MAGIRPDGVGAAAERRGRAQHSAGVAEEPDGSPLQPWNALFEAWSKILADPGPVSLFGIEPSDGLDAAFELEPITAFSRSQA